MSAIYDSTFPISLAKQFWSSSLSPPSICITFSRIFHLSCSPYGKYLLVPSSSIHYRSVPLHFPAVRSYSFRAAGFYDLSQDEDISNIFKADWQSWHHLLITIAFAINHSGCLTFCLITDLSNSYSSYWAVLYLYKSQCELSPHVSSLVPISLEYRDTINVITKWFNCLKLR